MYVLSDRSKEKYDTLHFDLKRVIDIALMQSRRDFAIIWGYRGKELQTKFYEAGTGLPYPHSYHNATDEEGLPCSDAFDFAPYPVDWNDTNGFIYLAGLFLQIGKEIGVELEWGGLWKRRDLGHIQRKR